MKNKCLRAKLMKTRLSKIWNFLFAFWLEIFTFVLPCYVIHLEIQWQYLVALLTLSVWWYESNDFHKDLIFHLCSVFILWYSIWIDLLHLPSLYKVLMKLTEMLQFHALLISVLNTWFSICLRSRDIFCCRNISS